MIKPDRRLRSSPSGDERGAKFVKMSSGGAGGGLRVLYPPGPDPRPRPRARGGGGGLGGAWGGSGGVVSRGGSGGARSGCSGALIEKTQANQNRNTKLVFGFVFRALVCCWVFCQRDPCT